MNVITSYSIHYTKLFVEDKKNEVSTYISDLKKWAIDWVENYVIDIVEPQLESKKQEIISDINSKIDNQKIDRITSYNVCYTKLLRLDILQ